MVVSTVRFTESRVSSSEQWDRSTNTLASFWAGTGRREQDFLSTYCNHVVSEAHNKGSSQHHQASQDAHDNVQRQFLPPLCCSRDCHPRRADAADASFANLKYEACRCLYIGAHATLHANPGAHLLLALLSFRPRAAEGHRQTGMAGFL